MQTRIIEAFQTDMTATDCAIMSQIMNKVLFVQNGVTSSKRPVAGTTTATSTTETKFTEAEQALARDWLDALPHHEPVQDKDDNRW